MEKIITFFKKRGIFFYVCLFSIIAFLVCLVFASMQQIWFDEAYSLMVAKHSLGDIVSLSAVDMHPPFYYILLHFFGGLFAFNELALRVLSAVFYAASIGMVLFLVSKFFPKKTVIITGLILVLSPFILRYGFEIRMYAMASFIAVSSTLVLYYAYKNNKKWQWVLYGLLVAMGMYTTYMMIVVFIAQLVWLIVSDIKAKKFNRRWLIALIGAVLLFLPWVPTVFSQLGSSAFSGISTTFGLRQVADIVSYYLLYTPSSTLGFLDIALILLLLLALVLSAITIMKRKEFNRDGFWLFLTMFFVPILFFAVVSTPLLGIELYIERYTAQFAIFGYVLIGIVLANLRFTPKKSNNLAIIATVLVLAVGVMNLYSYGNFNFQRNDRPQNKDNAKVISGFCDETIIVDDLYTYIELSSYIPEDCNFYYYSNDEVEYMGGYAPLSLVEEKRLDNDEILRLDGSSFVIVTAGNDPGITTSEEYLLLTVDSSLSYKKMFVYERQ